jgi:hypothetical protein
MNAATGLKILVLIEIPPRTLMDGIILNSIIITRHTGLYEELYIIFLDIYQSFK